MEFRFIIFFLFLVNAESSSQTIRKPALKTYKIEGLLLNGAGKKIYLEQNDLFQNNVEKDSTIIDNKGTFTFSGKLKEPSMRLLRIDGSNKAGVKFYIDGSVIKIAGNADSLWQSKITGSKEEDIRQEYQSKIWLKSRGGLMREYDSITVSIRKAKEINDTIALQRLATAKSIFFVRLDSAIMSLMKKYPLAISSVDHVTHFIDKHLASDHNFSEPDSILRDFESSKIGHYSMIKMLRTRIDNLKQLKIGDSAPEFIQKDTSGKTISMSSFKGQFVLLDFWASWCGPCRQQNPHLVSLYDRYKQRKFMVVSVSLDSDKQAWIKAIIKDRLDWVHLSDLKGRENFAASRYGVNGIPSNFLIDPQGKIIAMNVTTEVLEEKLKEIFR